MADQRYLVSARKYRPQLFKDLVAQEHVSETLKNAIRMDRLAHAYLFSGPRGVGKTTAARILAKAINCTTPLEERGDRAEPCRVCDSCRSFEEGRNLNIIEIDAASNNKVEDVRELRETVRIPPQGNRKKVYIIDEVHMLSTGAFNALLKTLEEPPPYVLFIFATTEPHKVLPTILSRCQRFDFRRVSLPEIVGHLHEISTAENVVADEESLVAIARRGDGAMRDALSAFDQAVSLCGNRLDFESLSRALRLVDIDLFFTATEHAANRNAGGMLQLVDEIVRSGYDFREFLVGLSEHLRNLLVARTTGEGSLIEAVGATQQRYVEAAAAYSDSDLMRMLSIVFEGHDTIRHSAHPRFKLESVMLRMASLSHSVDLKAALARIDQLETAIREGKAPAAPAHAGLAPAAPVASPAPPAPSSAGPRPREASAPIHRLSPTPAPAPKPAPEPASKPEPESGPENEEPPAASLLKRLPVQEKPADAPVPERPAPASHMSLFPTPALQRRTPPTSGGSGPSAMFEGSGALATAEPAPAVSPAFQTVQGIWPEYVKQVFETRIQLGALLEACNPVCLDGSVLIVDVPSELHQRMLEREHGSLVEYIGGLTGAVSKFRFNVQPDVEPPDGTRSIPRADPSEVIARKRQESPVIQAIFEQFGGELVW